MKQIQVTSGGVTIDLNRGITVGEALRHFIPEQAFSSDYQSDPVVSAVVGDTHVSLSQPLSYDCSIAPVRLFSNLGKRCYRQSLCFLLGAAAQHVMPDRRLTIGYALGDGYYFFAKDGAPVTELEVRMLEEEMLRLIKADIGIHYELVSHQEAVAWFGSRMLLQTKGLLETTNNPHVEVYRMDDVMDVAYDPIVPKSGLLSVWELRPFKGTGLLLRYPRSFDFTKLDAFKKNDLLFSALETEKQERPTMNVGSISDLNRISQSPQVVPYIRLCEERQTKRISDIADQICARGKVKFVFICGPSSSGKTTFAYKLCTQLEVRGKQTIELSLDNYYLTPDKCPKDKDGKPDFEVLEALNLPLLQEQLSLLSKGEAVGLPTYHFIEKKTTFGKPVRLGENTILVIEGIHGMNPRLTESVEAESLFRIYISAFTQVNITDHNRISTTDNRIIRRIVRDHRTRASSALETLQMMPNVQRGENLYIFPYQNNADVMINSALDYELAVLAPFAQPLLRAVGPEEGEYYVQARRLLGFLDNFQPIREVLVPSSSLLREFIGGSEYGVT